MPLKKRSVSSSSKIIQYQVRLGSSLKRVRRVAFLTKRERSCFIIADRLRLDSDKTGFATSERYLREIKWSLASETLLVFCELRNLIKRRNASRCFVNQYFALETHPLWSGFRFRLTRGHGLPDGRHDLLFKGRSYDDPLNFSLDLYLSTTVDSAEYDRG
ncbi:hypothetical protein AVEN_129514-1 [Araneus ventricosus]|uniref:Uncharacterized protein n=1 Tax=Araneus ventricosus TaxID=182803 RepID=A0A4Y2GLD8_ARAVE|nr:hypothetical protein AVEN_129514-1 [Araneus ventricosus]